METRRSDNRIVLPTSIRLFHAFLNTDDYDMDSMLYKKAFESKGRVPGLFEHIPENKQPQIADWTGLMPLFRGTKSISKELDEYVKNTIPESRLVWTSYRLFPAEIYAEQWDAHSEKGVIVYQVHNIPNLLQVYFRAGRREVDEQTLQELDGIVESFSSMKLTRSKFNNARERFSETIEPLLNNDPVVRPSLLGLAEDTETRNKIFNAFAGTRKSDYDIERNEMTRIVHTKYNGWFNEADDQQVMLWNAGRWLKPALLYKKRDGFSFVYSVESWIPCILNLDKNALQFVEHNKRLPAWLQSILLLATYPKEVQVTQKTIENMQLPEFVRNSSFAAFLQNQTLNDKYVVVDCPTTDRLEFDIAWRKLTHPDVRVLLETSFAQLQHMEDVLIPPGRGLPPPIDAEMRFAMSCQRFLREADFESLSAEDKQRLNYTFAFEKTYLRIGTPKFFEFLERGADFRYFVTTAGMYEADGKEFWKFILETNFTLPPIWLAPDHAGYEIVDALDKRTIEAWKQIPLRWTSFEYPENILLDEQLDIWASHTKALVLQNTVSQTMFDSLIKNVQMHIITQTTIDKVLSTFLKLAQSLRSTETFVKLDLQPIWDKYREPPTIKNSKNYKNGTHSLLCNFPENARMCA